MSKMLSLFRPYHICCVSILSILYPLTIFLNKNNTNLIEKGCGVLNFSLFITSEFFWVNPIRYGLFHRIDGVVAKTTFLYFLVYTLNKNNLSMQHLIEYYFTILLFLATFYGSNYFSSRIWCCKKHLFFHVLLHMLTSHGMKFAYF